LGSSVRALREGTLIRRFKAEDGREVTLRAPRWSDLDDALDFINSLVEEGAEINVNQKTTRDAETDWMARHLSAVEKDKNVAVVAEVDGKFVGQVTVEPQSGYHQHVGVLGIAIRSGYRDIGIGTELMREAEIQARRLGLKILRLEVYATNSRAHHVYEKQGYRVVGRVPKVVLKDGAYTDSIIMTKEL
jgi:ribosomal protein S18 acetylase RimI-like enzyme